MSLKRRAVLNGFDLKRKYRQNMLVGFVSAGLFFLLAFAAASGWNKNTPQPIFKIDANDSTRIIFIPPPPPERLKRPDRVDTDPQKPPELGEIIPVPEEEIPEDNITTIFDDILNWVPDQPDFDPIEYASTENIERIIGSLLPGRDDFVPYDEGPVYVNQVHPEYPPLAQRAGMEGTVWLKALIDKDGVVRDVIILKNSGSNAGFEESAIKAAWGSVWKPALANGQPIAVWVSFATKFKLQ